MKKQLSRPKRNLVEIETNIRIQWVFAVVSVLSVVLYLFPFVNYKYKGIVYTLNGWELIMGKTVCGGSVALGMNGAVLISLIAVAVVLVTSFLYPVLNKKLRLGIVTISSIVIIVCNIVLAMDIKNMLRKAKAPRIDYASVILVAVFFLILCYGVYILWKMKVLVTLDFMVLPGMLYSIINNYIPMFGITIAFKKVDYSLGVYNSPWVGLENFKVLFSYNGDFFKSDAFIITRNTLLYNATFIFLGILAGVIVGICLADIFSRILQKFFQTSILLPQLISMVIVAYIVYALLSNETGMVNNMLDESVNFYQERKYWPFILVFVYVWKQVGYNAIIFLSSIVGIDRSIYEAAKVDGASKWQQIRHVTLPMLKPKIITLMLLQVGRIFYSDFGLFYQVPLDSGTLYNVTNTVDTYVYRCLMVLNNVSVAAAGSTYQAVVGFILVFTVNMLVRKFDKENALF